MQINLFYSNKNWINFLKQSTLKIKIKYNSLIKFHKNLKLSIQTLLNKISKKSR